MHTLPSLVHVLPFPKVVIIERQLTFYDFLEQYISPKINLFAKGLNLNRSHGEQPLLLHMPRLDFINLFRLSH